MSAGAGPASTVHAVTAHADTGAVPVSAERGGRDRWSTTVVLAPIRFYRRRISPLFAPRCRFYPSCSTYALQAVKEHGAARGLVLALWRLLRCNPLNNGGVDDVPERFALHLHAHDRWPTPGDELDPNPRVAAPKE